MWHVLAAARRDALIETETFQTPAAATLLLLLMMTMINKAAA